ncbi:sugar phosphate nucleotidyltransferase [Petrachloros mirabilis]
MTDRDKSRRQVWSLVLAGGEGERVRPLVIRWLGRHRPKQYCAFVGTRSMFQHTVDRARRHTSGEKTIVIASRNHRSIVDSQLAGRAVRKVVMQPANRDTAAGIFLPLSYLRRLDPKAIVVIHPSDHFIFPEHRFLAMVREAVTSVDMMPDRPMLLGVQPDRLELEYGWIRRGPRLNGFATHPVHAVSSFLEKPAVAQADAALRSGGLWNTLVVIATVESLWQAGWHCFPDMMPLFEPLASVWDTAEESAALDEAYKMMPSYNFSSQLLQTIPDGVAVMELTGVLWSDWGKPQRIVETLCRIGKSPAFPLECLDRPFVPHSIPETFDQMLASA